MERFRDLTAFILAGGLGTRLASVLGGGQKVVAPVAGRPFLTLLLDRLSEAGLRRAVLCVGHRAEEVRAALGNSYRGMDLVYSAEPRPLGTGGALRYALPHAESDPLLAMNGDSLCEGDLEALWKYHAGKKARATLLLTEVPDTGRYGRVKTDESGRVTAFEEKDAVSGRGWINAGVYIMNREFLTAVPADRTVSLEREIFPAAVGRGLYGYRGGGRFLDIGTPDALEKAQSFFRAEGEK